MKNSIKDYSCKYEGIMIRYEETVREWLREQGGIHAEIADIIPFFRDGIVCPENWYNNSTGHRPLFIMKEVSIGRNGDSPESLIVELNDYNALWGNIHCYEFATNPFDDIRIGKYRTWQKVAKLAKALEMHTSEIDEYDFTMKPNGLAYTGDNPGYKEKCSSRTSNRTYIDTIDSVAVINIKKIGGGKRADSILSEAGKYYTEHLTPKLLEILVEQIGFIEPSIIVLCCGPTENTNIECMLKPYFEGVQFAKSYHPSYWRISDKAFCQNVLNDILTD